MLLTLGELTLQGATFQRPKPLLLLAYLTLEGPTPRRKLAGLFYSDTKDPLDSLATAVGYLRRHPEAALIASPNTVATSIKNDVEAMFLDLDQGDVDRALSRYRGPFLASYDLPLGEELEDWLYAQQDKIAQQFRRALLDLAETQPADAATRLAERAWVLTRDQGVDVSDLNRLYRLMVSGKSPGVHDVRRFAGEYGMPIDTLVTRPNQPAEIISVPAHQVDDLVNHLEELRYSTHGLALCLQGEAGVGKTWTLEQVRSKLSFASYFTDASLTLRDLPQRLPRAAALPAWARTIMSRMGDTQPVQLDDTADAVAEVLATHAPVVLQVEDLHGALPERVRFWEHLAEIVKRSPGVALVATSRGKPPDVFDAQRVRPLEAAEVARILEHEVGSELPSGGLSWIYDRAAGNPLFSLEFLRFLRRRGYLWHDGRVWHWRLPETEQLPVTVEALISHAIRDTGLSARTLTLAHVKALLPPTAPRDFVLRAAGFDQDGGTVEENQLVERGIFRASGGAFAHPLYAEAYVQGLSSERRRHLAAQLVTQVGESDPLTAAIFVSDAGLSEERSKDLLLHASAVAAAQGREKQAGDLAAQAATYAHRKEKVALLLKAAGHLKTTSTAKARELTERVLLVDPDQIEARLLLAECLVNLGEGERAEAMLGHVESSSFQQQLFELLVRLRTDRNDYPGAIALWEGQLAYQASASPQTKSRAAFALANMGQFEQAHGLAASTLALGKVPPEALASLLEVQGVVAYYQGDIAAALVYCEESIDSLRTIPGSSALPHLMNTLRLRAAVNWALLAQSRAIQDTEEAMRIASELGSGRAYAIAQTYLGVPMTETGEYERAEEALLESRELLRRVDAREHLAACEAILGGVYINWNLPGMAARGLQHVYASLSISEDIGSPVLVTQSCIYVSWAETLVGSPTTAEAFATRGLTTAQQIGQARYLSLCYWMRGLARGIQGQLEGAVADLDAAIELVDEMQLEGFRLLFSIDRDCFRGDREALRKHLEAASIYNFSGLRFPLRQKFRDELGL